MGTTIVDRVVAVVALLLFGVAIVLPILLLIINALDGNSIEVFIQSNILASIVNSLLISLPTAVISTLIGTALAFILIKTNLPLARPAKLLFLLPLFLPPYILAVAWSDLLFAFNHKNLLDNAAGVIFILTLVYTPIAVFIISGSLINIHRYVEEAGETMCRYRIVFIRIVLPLIRPALLSSFVLIFVLSISEFTVPSYFSVSVLTTEIFTEFTAFYNYQAAITQSIALIVLCLVVIYPERAFLSKASFWSLGKKGFQQRIIELQSPYFLLLICTIYLTMTEFLPLGYLIFQSLRNGLNDVTRALQLLIPEILSTVVLALEGSLLLLLFGYVFAKLSLTRKWEAIDFVLLFVFAIPSTVLGISLIRFFNSPSFNFIYGSSMIVLIAYLARFVFVSQRIISANMRQIPTTYNEAAVIIGVPSFVRLIRIQLPLLSEGLFNVFCICFLFCMSELGATILVYPPGTSLLPVRVFTLMANSSEGLINAMNVVVLVATLVVIIFLLFLKRIFLRKPWK